MLIRFLAATLLTGLLHVAPAQPPVRPKATSGNPLFPGWYADPEVAVFGKQYWIYPTYSAKYEQQVFMDAFSSADLVNWVKHPAIIDTAAVKWAKKAMWAPSVTEKDGKYFLFFSANDVHEGEVGGIGVAVADNPAGPFRDYLGKPLVGQIHNGAQPIDQFVFRDKDGQYYLIYGGWRHCNIAKLNADFRGFTPFSDGKVFHEITPEGYVEGPMLFIRDGRYYFMWSEGNWTGPDYSVAYAVADSPFGPFKRAGKVLQQDPKIATGAGHHSILQIPDQSQPSAAKADGWYIIYHRRPLTETDGNHRETCLDRLEFDEQGAIKPVQITTVGVTARPLTQR